MKNLTNSIDVAINYLGKENYSSFDISYSKIDNRSELSIIKNGNKITIFYGEVVSIFYGLTIIKLKKNIDSYEVHYHKNFASNGLMHDCSRNGVINLDSIKKFILIHALFGLNRLLLYTEDVYELDNEPMFGYLRGRYSKKELKEAVEYAESFGVEIVPCIQTLSHLNQALRWDRYSEVRETGKTLLIGKEETYLLIEKMIKSCREVFKSEHIHIGMDEAIDLGVPRYMYRNKVIDKKIEFLSHLNRVVDICKKYNFSPIMWGDMFFKLISSSENWYEDGVISDEIKSLIPDVGLVYWDYYHDDQKIYDQMFKTLKETGKETYFAGGAISWIGFAPNIFKSLEISKTGLKSSIKNKINNVFVTSWGDNGNECTIWSSLPSLALYSTFDYQGNCDNKELSKVLEAVTGDPLKTWGDLELPNKLKEDIHPYENPSKPFLYQDPLNGIYDYKVKDCYGELYKKYAQQLKRDAKRSKNFSHIYTTLSNLCSLLEYKVDIGVKLRKAYQSKDREGLKLCLDNLRKIIKRLDAFKKSYQLQWMKENKAQGFDVIDGRLGYLNNRLITAYNLVKDYLDKKINSIPELEEKIVAFDDNDDSIINANSWAFAASVNLI